MATKIVETQNPTEEQAAGELHFDEVHIERTTPQGTQEKGVAHGHENRDVLMAPLMCWLGGTAVFLAITFVAMRGMWNVMENIAASRDVLPSPLFNMHAAPPPGQPRLYPNPDQKANDPKLPWEVGAAHRLSEDQQLQSAGLATINPAENSTIAQVPANDLSYVTAEQPKTSTAPPTDMDKIYSQASGGTKLEGRWH